MTQAEIQQHPFWHKFQARLPAVIDGITRRSMISPSESGYLVQYLKNNYNAMFQLIENLNMRYGEITDQQMDSEIFQWIQPAVQQVRAHMNRMGGGFGVGFNPGAGGFGVQPIGFGYDSCRRAPGVPMSPFGGNTGGSFDAVGGGSGGIGSLFGGSTTAKKDIPQQMKPQSEKKVVPVDWKEPTKIDSNTLNLGNGVEVTVGKYELFNGSIAREIIVHDPKVGYVSDQEVLNKYKQAFKIFPDSSKKIMTISYQQLKLAHVSREEFTKLAQSVTVAAGRVSGVEAKLRAIISTAGHFNKNAYEEFSRIFIDELEYHILCGELCDSFHPKNILSRPSKLEDILSWVTGDVDKAMLSAMKGMEGFEERLTKLLEVLIDEFASGLSRRVLNTKTDMTTLDDLYRALPGLWTEDCGLTFQNSDDLVDIFLATRETIEGSKSASAVKSESVLKTKLDELNKQFTLLFVPRVVTWCNYAKSDVCRYDDKGNCQPACTSNLQPRNDVEFFINSLLNLFGVSKDTMIKWSPRNIYMEIDEETFVLQYGRTTNNCTWIGTAIYWH